MQPRSRSLSRLGVALLLLINIGPHTFAYGAEITVAVKPDVKAFAPPQVTITAHDRVRWVNEDHEDHFLTSAGPVSGPPVLGTENLMIHRLLKPGESYTHLFSDPETYYYFCAIHLQMWGVVIVEP